MTAKFVKGAEFASYTEFDEALKEFQRNTGTIFVISNSKSVESANTKVKNGQKNYEDKFKYRYIKLTCKHFGSVRIASSSKSETVQRPNQSTFKIGCPVFITASVDRSKNKLIVLELCLEHSHETEIAPIMYPENRRLNEDERKTCLSMIETGVPVQKICNLIIETTGKPITLRDIHNIRAQKKKLHANLLNLTNNTIESHNKQIKTIDTHTSKPHYLFEEVMMLNNSKSVECVYEHAIATNTLQYQHLSEENTDIISVANKICTPYAVDLLLKQINSAYKDKNKTTFETIDDEVMINFDGKTIYRINIMNMTCNCVFNSTTKLPCKHVILYRMHMQLEPIVEESIPQCWQKSYQSRNILSQIANEPNVWKRLQLSHGNVLSKIKKYKLVSNVTKKITDIVCSVGQNEFLTKLELLEDLVNRWSSNKTVILFNEDTQSGEHEPITITDAVVPESTCSTFQMLSSTDEAEPITSTDVVAQEPTCSKFQMLLNEVAEDVIDSANSLHQPPLELKAKCLLKSPDSHAFVENMKVLKIKDMILPIRNTVGGRPKGAAATVNCKTRGIKRKFVASV